MPAVEFSYYNAQGDAMDSNDQYYEAGSADAEPSENGELLSPFLTPPLVLVTFGLIFGCS